MIFNVITDKTEKKEFECCAGLLLDIQQQIKDCLRIKFPFNINSFPY